MASSGIFSVCPEPRSPRLSDQLDLIKYAQILETAEALDSTLEGLPERLARHCRWKMMLHAGRWWLGGSLATSGQESLRRLGWVPPGAGVVAADRRGALELARLCTLRDGVSVRIYRPDGRPAFTVLVPRRDPPVPAAPAAVDL
jgi:hypothetical protein